MTLTRLGHLHGVELADLATRGSLVIDHFLLQDARLGHLAKEVQGDLLTEILVLLGDAKLGQELVHCCNLGNGDGG